MAEKIRKLIYFSGTVQGVGFRWKAKQIASSLGLTGRVRNLYDGRVEMEVQGDEPSIDRMMIMLSEQRYIYIDSYTARSMELRDNERGFYIDD